MKKSNNKTIYDALGRDPVHPFPARMAPGIALDYLSRGKIGKRVLDPMMGSGTVLALARSQGHKAIGVDLDPLAVLISKVWTCTVDEKKVAKTLVHVFDRAQVIYRSLSLRDAYPAKADRETRQFIRYWFDAVSRRQLTSLAQAISGVRDESTRNVLWCGFSRLIITKQAGASLAMDLSHSRPHRSYDVAPIKPFDHFRASVSRTLENCISGKKEKGPAPLIKHGDARKLQIESDSIDLVLTSPPYLNAIDYMRCSKFTLVWMGVQTAKIREIRSESIGTEVGDYANSQGKFSKKTISRLRLGSKLSRRSNAVLSSFIRDMEGAIAEVARVLVPGGKAVYVVGENTVKGTFIPNAKIIVAIAGMAGLKLQKRTTRTLPPNRRYLPPPSNQRKNILLDGRMRREVILCFRKPKPRQKSRA